MQKRALLLFVLIACFVGTTYATNCEDYYSMYDCVYQFTEQGSMDPEADCSVCESYPYDPEFAVATGVCSYSEFNETAEAFEVLYGNLWSEQQHLLAMEQCKALSSTGDVSGCFDACAEITTGAALSACMSVCVYDDSFGANLDFIPLQQVCSSNEWPCVASCLEYSYLEAHCQESCNLSCDYNSFKKWGSFNLAGYCGDGVVANGEECDDGQNYNGDGCDYNCHREEGYPKSTSGDDGDYNGNSWLDDLFGEDWGTDTDHPSVVEQLVAHGDDGMFPGENVDPDELPKAGAFKLDTLTSKVLMIIALMSMFGLTVVANRQK